MRNEITNATLDLEGIEVLAASIGDDQIELVVESRHDAGCCPACGRAALEPKERPETLVRDLPISGRPTVLVWRKRRWRCTSCRRSFTETHPQMPPRARMTAGFKAHLAARARAEGNFAQVARTEAVAHDTVARTHRSRAELIRAALPRPSPRVLAIDEAAFKKGRTTTRSTSRIGESPAVVAKAFKSWTVECQPALDGRTNTLDGWRQPRCRLHPGGDRRGSICSILVNRRT